MLDNLMNAMYGQPRGNSLHVPGNTLHVAQASQPQPQPQPQVSDLPPETAQGLRDALGGYSDYVNGLNQPQPQPQPQQPVYNGPYMDMPVSQMTPQQAEEAFLPYYTQYVQPGMVINPDTEDPGEQMQNIVAYQYVDMIRRGIMPPPPGYTF